MAEKLLPEFSLVGLDTHAILLLDVQTVNPSYFQHNEVLCYTYNSLELFTYVLCQPACQRAIGG
jgi:hypothetical protein